MRRIDEMMKTIYFILMTLKGRSMRWTDLHRKVISQNISQSTFRYMLEWLIKNEYVKRCKRGLYDLTENGLKLLDAIPKYKLNSSLDDFI